MTPPRLMATCVPVVLALTGVSGCARTYANSKGPVTTTQAAPNKLMTFTVRGVTTRWVHKGATYDAQSIEWMSVFPKEATHRALAVGYPMEPYLRLVASGPTGDRLISWPSDLSGLIRITTPGQALEFVRLFSSAETWYRFPMYPYIEIEPVPDLLTDPASGVAPILQKQFEELGLPRTEAIRFGGVFRIRRPVLVTSRTDLDKRSIEGFAVVDEMVSEEGGYQVRVLWYKAAQRDTIRTSLRRYQ